jgi:hypothetical protein
MVAVRTAAPASPVYTWDFSIGSGARKGRPYTRALFLTFDF